MPLDLFEYQKDGAVFLAGKERAGLFDEMRVGKTAQAIRACDLLGHRRGLVICPGTARGVWFGEWPKFQLQRRSVVRGLDVHDLLAWQRGRFDVMVTSYEQATNWAGRIIKEGEILDFVIVDEGHYCKNAMAARTKAVLGDFVSRQETIGLVDFAKSAWILTGTPMANDPMDIYTFLKFVRAMPLKQEQFQNRYFSSFKKTFGERNTPKPDKVDELKRLIWNNALRRTQKEAGLQLPPIFLTSVTIDGDTTHIRELLAQYPGLDGAILQALQTGGLSFLDAQHIATLRRLVGEAKAVPYAAMLYDEMQNSSQKIVVMAAHTAALKNVQNYLAARGITTVLVNGETPQAHREAYIYAFQNDPKVRCFLGNIRAAGIAVSLTASPFVDMLESSWSPADNAQAIMRVQGVTQGEPIRARFITLANSIDEAVTSIVAEKTSSIVTVQGGQLFTHEG